MAEKYNIGFLGLGHMGVPTAVNLVKAGYTVAGFDVVPAALERARTSGVPAAASAVEAVSGADVVFSMFPSGRQVLITNCPVPGHVPTSPANRGYQPGLAARVGPLAADIYDTFAAEGSGSQEFSAIISYIRSKSESQANPFKGVAASARSAAAPNPGGGVPHQPPQAPHQAAQDDGSPE